MSFLVIGLEKVPNIVRMSVPQIMGGVNMCAATPLVPTTVPAIRYHIRHTSIKLCQCVCVCVK